MDLILVTGVSNAGKSAFFLNFTEMNKDKHEIRYVSSEWDNEERDAQLRDFGVDIDEWDNDVDFYYKERSRPIALDLKKIKKGHSFTKNDVTYEIGEGIELPGEHNVIPTPLPKVIGVEDPEVREKEEQIYK